MTATNSLPTSLNGLAQAELFEVMRRAKREWEMTFDAMSEGVFIFDREGRLARVNRAGALLENALPQEIIGKQCCALLAGDGARGCVVADAIHGATCVKFELTTTLNSRFLLLTVEPIVEDGITRGAVCTAHDLTELRRLQSETRKQRSVLNNILENAREAIFALDAEGDFLWYNRATIAELCPDREDFECANFFATLHPDDRALARAALARAFAGERQHYEARYFMPGQEIRHLTVAHTPLVTDGEILGVLGIARDTTTERLESERAAQADKLQALGQLASGVAHDFNNALAAILGRTQLLARRFPTDSEEARALEIIHRSAEDAAETVKRIQTFARKDGMSAVAALDVAALVRDAVEITRPRWFTHARVHDIEYVLTVEAATPVVACGNAMELREVFINLIGNALDAMPEGGKLSIVCATEANAARVVFTDTGSGIAPELLERIYEPFFTTKGAQGTGLGLSVSYNIIRRHSGQIKAKSSPGAGATFEIVLPFPAAETVPEKHAPVDSPQESASQALSVLVLDDEDFVRDTLAEMIGIFGHRAQTAGRGAEALARLQTQRFDILFTDLAMPGMDGWEVARVVRETYPDMSIVLCTGFGQDAGNAETSTLIDEVIGKPFDFAQIAAVFDKLTITKN